MLKVFICLLGVFIILMVAEALWRLKILKGENQRKFVHITVGVFIAFWPWLISWRAIQLISLAMFIVILLNRQFRILHISGGIRRIGYGDSYYPAAIVLCSLLTTNKVFFALAILHLCLADGMAAVIGTSFGKTSRYKVFHQTKSVVGSLTFWFVSTCILAVGLLAANSVLDFNDYWVLILVLPPILTLLENVGTLGLDNILVPVAVIIALNLAQ